MKGAQKVLHSSLRCFILAPQRLSVPAVFHSSQNNFLCHWLILCCSHLSKPATSLSWAEVGTQRNWEGTSVWRCRLQTCGFRHWDWLLAGLKSVWQGRLQARHHESPRDTSLLGRGLSAPEEISLMRHISCPAWWPLSPECHISVTGSC